MVRKMPGYPLPNKRQNAASCVPHDEAWVPTSKHLRVLETMQFTPKSITWIYSR